MKKTWLEAPKWTTKVGLALMVLFIVLAVLTSYFGGNKWVAFSLLFCSAPSFTIFGIPAVWAAIKNRNPKTHR